jgi:ABC-type proline/glycine betaine transport system ATPase subunit
MDKILVMDHGRVVEYDTPIALLENPKSKFSMMVSQTGDIDLSKLREIALNSLESKTQGKSFSLDRTSQSNRSQESHTGLPRSLVEIFARPEIQSLSTQSMSSNSSITSDQQTSFHSADIELLDLNKQSSSSDALLENRPKGPH